MKFDELYLELAVAKAGVKGDPVRDDARRELVKAVFDQWLSMFATSRFPFEIEDVCHAAVRIRKRGSKTPQAWEIAEAHQQFRCFWERRGKGPCSDEVECGHVVPRAHGSGDITIENGMIECRAHNNQRRNRTIDEYLRSDDRTL